MLADGAPDDRRFAQPRRVLVVEGHPIFAAGLRHLLEQAEPRWVATTSGSGHAALELLRQEPIDLLILDLSLPDWPGLDVLSRALGWRSDLRVLVCTARLEITYARRAYASGALGYLTKDAGPAEWLMALRAVAGGAVHVMPSMAAELALSLCPSHTAPPGEGIEGLSTRELEVLRQVVGGVRPCDIARTLNMSIKTVSSHGVRIRQKLRLPSLAAMVRFGLEHGLSAPEGLPGGRHATQALELPSCRAAATQRR